jgi:hypothetical protein
VQYDLAALYQTELGVVDMMPSIWIVARRWHNRFP